MDYRSDSGVAGMRGPEKPAFGAPQTPKSSLKISKSLTGKAHDRLPVPKLEPAGSLGGSADPAEPVPDETAAPRKELVLDADIRSKTVSDHESGGKKELIRDVRVQVLKGDLVALLGGSGAGKTTVMNCINGVDQSGVSGKISFCGQNLYEKFDQLKSRIGNVPQQIELHTMLSVEEELKEAALIRLPASTKRKEIKRRVDEAIHTLKLDAVRKSKIAKLSGGEQKRVNIGVELVADRMLLCLDEPDAGLDPASKRELFLILRDLAKKRDKSMIVIIHDIAEIALFDKVIMMAKVHNVGRLAFCGTPEKAKQHFGVEDLRDAYVKLAQAPEEYIAKEGA